MSRVAAYATKAMREAKTHTSWTDPDEAYEDAVQGFVAGVLGDAALVGSIDRFVAGLLAPGRATALVQVALAATIPGAPDLYQGDEIWNLSLVDPDNRRPVDHAHLDALLTEVRTDPDLDLTGLWQRTAGDPDDDGLVKLALWHRLLALRAERPAAFAGAYRPLPVAGDAAHTHLAFVRGEDVAVVASVRGGVAHGHHRASRRPLARHRHRRHPSTAGRCRRPIRSMGSPWRCWPGPDGI